MDAATVIAKRESLDSLEVCMSLLEQDAKALPGNLFPYLFRDFSWHVEELRNDPTALKYALKMAAIVGEIRGMLDRMAQKKSASQTAMYVLRDDLRVITDKLEEFVG